MGALFIDNRGLLNTRHVGPLTWDRCREDGPVIAQWRVRCCGKLRTLTWHSVIDRRGIIRAGRVSAPKHTVQERAMLALADEPCACKTSTRALINILRAEARMSTDLDVMIALSDLGSSPDAALRALPVVQARARTRLLDEGDVRSTWDLAMEGRALCQDIGLDPAHLRVTTDAGAVCNSYGWSARSTSVTVWGDGQVSVDRLRARSCAHGGGGRTFVSYPLDTDAWARLGTRRNSIDLPLALRRWRRAQRAGLSLTGASLLWADAAEVQRRARRVWRARRRLGGDRRDIEQWLLAALSSDDVTDLHRAIDAGEQLMRRTS